MYSDAKRARRMIPWKGPSLHRDPVHSPLIAAFVKHYEELVNHVRHRFGDCPAHANADASGPCA